MNSAAPARAIDVALVAGGTGGHVYPAIAVADALRGLDPSVHVDFAVDARPASADAVRRAGFEPEILPMSRGLQRGRSFSQVAATFGAFFALMRSFGRSVRWLRATRPAAVVGFGAYVTVPVVLAARLLRIPVVVHEQNGVPGLANRLAVRLGARAATSVPGTPLRGAILIGNPIRAQIVGIERQPQSPPLVAFVGASLGAGVLNECALDLYDRWRDRTDVAVRLVSGADLHDACRTRLDALRSDGDRLEFDLVPYEHDMAGLYARATLMVTRGGGTVMELAAVGMPAVVVPWPGATEDHQSANARAVAAVGGAVHVPESECDVDRIAAAIDALLADPQRLASMSAAMRGFARPDAAETMARLVLEAAA
jgi:UDP-N-acetylglucosamine--N-acetylmuramyl-(pentapeptide) pyrophosphoryl-undecaprenol N-acetylglucosamine transferase